MVGDVGEVPGWSVGAVEADSNRFKLELRYLKQQGYT